MAGEMPLWPRFPKATSVRESESLSTDEGPVQK
jgi:hypothetical protein